MTYESILEMAQEQGFSLVNDFESDILILEDDFGFPEAYFLVDENGEAVEIDEDDYLDLYTS